MYLVLWNAKIVDILLHLFWSNDLVENIFLASIFQQKSYKPQTTTIWVFYNNEAMKGRNKEREWVGERGDRKGERMKEDKNQ